MPVEARGSRIVIDSFAAEVLHHFPAVTAGIVRQLPDVRDLFPMRSQTAEIASCPIAPVEAFLQTVDNARYIGSSDIVLRRATLPETVEVWVQNHA